MIPNLPSGWVEQTFWWMAPAGRLGYYNRTAKIIHYFPRWWLAPIWWLLAPFIRKHERGHAWGLDDCLGDHPWCVMYEDEDDWESKIRLLPVKVLGLGDYCPCCRSFLDRHGAFEVI